MPDSDPVSANSNDQPVNDEAASDDQSAKVEDFDFEFNEDFEGEIENEYKAILDWQFDNDAQGVSQPYVDEDADDNTEGGGACNAKSDK